VPSTVFDNPALLRVNPEYLASRMLEGLRKAGWREE
jgi:hypothetical protein